jgi:hypothetical protein
LITHHRPFVREAMTVIELEREVAWDISSLLR